jgi:Rieske Fe-S protein
MTEAHQQGVPDRHLVVGRRSVLRGVVAGGAAAAGGALLAACGSDSGGSDSGASAQPTPTTSQSGEGSSGPEVLVATADVPEGGGVILKDQEVVVTQPKKGEFVGLSAICTHQGCEVGDVSNGTINCPCHGSKFSIEDGAVVNGPATSPLPAVDLTVDGDSVVRA